MSNEISKFVPSSKIFDNMNLSSVANSEKDSSNPDSFMNVLQSKLDDINDKFVDSQNLTEQFIKGDNVAIHDVMLAGEEAKMSLELAVQVRNKIVDAYQELNRTQI